MNNQLAEIAAMFDLDQNALNSLMEYLVSNITKSPDMLVIIGSGDSEKISEMLTSGVEQWHKHSVEFLSNLAYSDSDEWVTKRHQLTEEVYVIIKSPNQ